jgi:hypothetical protein
MQDTAACGEFESATETDEAATEAATAPAPAPAARLLTAPAPAPAPGAAPDGDDGDMLAECDNAIEVVLSMSMTVDDPETFVASQSAREAVAAGIATAVGVSRMAVEVTLSVGGSRRLSAPRLGGPRRLSGTVVVEATIQTDSSQGQSVAQLQALVEAVDETTLADAITTELEERPWLNADVEIVAGSISVAEAAPPADAPRPVFASSRSQTTNNNAFKAAVASKLVLGLVAQLVYLSC